MPIDIHSHYIPGQLLQAIRENGADIGVELVEQAEGGQPSVAFDYGFKARPFFDELAAPTAERRAWLDGAGLDRQLVATWPDIYGYGLVGDSPVAWHKMLNDTLAEWCHGERDRFSWLGSAPLTDDSAAAAAVEYSASNGAVGMMISANIEGVNVGEFNLEKFWATSVKHDMPIILHPVMVVPEPRSRKYMLTQIAQYMFDTTFGLSSLIFEGVFDRHPGLKMLVAHGGAAFPFLSGRFDVMHNRMNKTKSGNRAKREPSAYFDRLAFDSIVHSPESLDLLIDRAGIENVQLGTDYSFPTAELDPLGFLKRSGILGKDARVIADDNPRRFFSRI